jgi:hypothetical protein
MANVTICPVHFDGMIVPHRLDHKTRNESKNREVFS